MSIAKTAEFIAWQYLAGGGQRRMANTRSMTLVPVGPVLQQITDGLEGRITIVVGQLADRMVAESGHPLPSAAINQGSGGIGRSVDAVGAECQEDGMWGQMSGGSHG
jgi:hypothetical protein